MQQYHVQYYYTDIFVVSIAAIQHNTSDKNGDICIATFIAFKDVSIRFLHHKNDWASCNHKYTVQCLAI